jgi:hypothetical protein
LAKERLGQDSEIHGNLWRSVVALGWGGVKGEQSEFGGAEFAGGQVKSN